MNKKTVLFISHDASRSGAPIFLLNLLAWFKKNTDIPFNVLIGNINGPQGELLNDFEGIAEPLLFDRNSSQEPKGPIRNAVNHYFSELVATPAHFRKLKKRLKQSNISLIYSNTIINGKILDFLSFLHCPVITHVHELNFWIQHRAGQQNLKFVKKYTTRYIAVSQAVKDNLVQNHDIPEKDIEIVYEFIPKPIQNEESTLKSHKKFFKQLNIPHNAFIVGASGTTDWRKGPDLFIQLALTVIKGEPGVPVHFIWVGGESPDIQPPQLLHDLKKSGIHDSVHFIGVRNNPFDYYNVFDVFALVSREDPFPLVMLEAASLGKPIICFDEAGGAKEFVQDDCGFVVPYLDIENMAERILYLVEDRILLKKLGTQAARKVERTHTLEHGAQNILDIINQFI